MKPPSASLVVSTLALAVAITGTAGAAAYINGNQIKPHTITSLQLARGAVKAPNVAAHAIHKSALADGVSVFNTINAPQGDPGPQGATGPQGVGNQGATGPMGPQGPAGQFDFAATVTVSDDASTATGGGATRASSNTASPTCISIPGAATVPIIVTPAPAHGGFYTATINRADGACGGNVGIYTINLNGGSPLSDAVSFSVIAL